jgi:hypothetical protein
MTSSIGFVGSVLLPAAALAFSQPFTAMDADIEARVGGLVCRR